MYQNFSYLTCPLFVTGTAGFGVDEKTLVNALVGYDLT
jgi:hypothetical protein